jgi:hypothetical protein
LGFGAVSFGGTFVVIAYSFKITVFIFPNKKGPCGPLM